MASETKEPMPAAAEQPTVEQTTTNEPNVALDVNGNEVTTEGAVESSPLTDTAANPPSEETAAAQVTTDNVPAETTAPANSSSNTVPSNTTEKSPSKPTEATKTEEELFRETMTKKMRHAFSVFDSTGNGTCDVREVGTIIRALGVAPSELQLQQLVKLMEDPSRGSTGYISFHRFSDVVYNCMVNQQPFAIPKDDEERIFQAFRTLDDSGAGYILPDKLRQLLTTMGEPFTNEEVDEMLAACSDPIENKVYYSDIISLLCV